MDIKGHAAVVTGGASGLGAATAEELARAGAKVACLDVNLDGARAVAERIGGCAVRCDVTDGEQAAAALAQARDQHGAARILINCAGVGPAKRIVGRDGPMPLADFERVIAINLIGTFNMMRLAAADMQNLSPLADEERGVIISAASVAAFEGQIGQAAYSASKGGVAALTMPAAREFAQFGIRVNAIAPGIFHTPMLMALPIHRLNTSASRASQSGATRWRARCPAASSRCSRSPVRCSLAPSCSCSTSRRSAWRRRWSS